MNYRTIGLVTGLLAASTALAGHHKASETMKPAASSGQVVVVYEVPCANPDQGVARLKERDRNMKPVHRRLLTRRLPPNSVTRWSVPSMSTNRWPQWNKPLPGKKAMRPGSLFRQKPWRRVVLILTKSA